MPLGKRELAQAVRLGIRTLILQEVRLLRLERDFTPRVVVEEMIHSIQGTKREIKRLTRSMDEGEKATLLKKEIRRAVDEEIEQAIQIRTTRCVRCIHGRFYDEAGKAHTSLPVRTRAETVGCDKLQPSLRKTCRRFVETATASSLEDYLNEITFLYEFREVIERIKEIWKDYLLKA